MSQATLIVCPLDEGQADRGRRQLITLTEFVARLRSGETIKLPEMVHSALLGTASQLGGVALGIRAREWQLMAWRRSNAASQRIETIPGVGLIAATALAASVPDPSVFRSGRQFAAYLGLVPRDNSSGGHAHRGMFR